MLYVIDVDYFLMRRQMKQIYTLCWKTYVVTLLIKGNNLKGDKFL